MAIVNAVVHRPPENVWEVLADGSLYASWVVGTQEIRAVDRGWPAPGSSIHYTVGLGPLHFQGRTTARVTEPGRRLGLEADAAPFGSARIVIELVPWGEDTVVALDEHPLRGPAFWLHSLVADPLLELRGRPMVRNLARLVESRFPRASRRPPES